MTTPNPTFTRVLTPITTGSSAPAPHDRLHHRSIGLIPSCRLPKCLLVANSYPNLYARPNGSRRRNKTKKLTSFPGSGGGDSKFQTWIPTRQRRRRSHAFKPDLCSWKIQRPSPVTLSPQSSTHSRWECPFGQL